MPKRKFKFNVILYIEELNAVPFVTDVLFCKIRLRNGGSYSGCTIHQNVSHHSVQWHQRFEFVCKMSCDTNTGILDPCITRLSVRKEVRGGKSSSKIGFVDINLAEFAGSNQRKKHCLLEGYKDKIRLDNSILKIVISIQLLSGDIVFKTPNTQQDTSFQISDTSSELGLTTYNSSSSSDLPRRLSQLKHVGRSNSLKTEPSAVSNKYDVTGKCSKHCESSCNQILGQSSTTSCSNLNRKASSSSQRTPKQHHKDQHKVIQSRLDETRVDAKDIVSKLIESQDFNQATNANDGDNMLQLFIASDGSKALGGQNFHHQVESGVFHPVV